MPWDHHGNWWCYHCNWWCNTHNLHRFGGKLMCCLFLGQKILHFKFIFLELHVEILIQQLLHSNQKLCCWSKFLSTKKLFHQKQVLGYNPAKWQATEELILTIRVFRIHNLHLRLFPLIWIATQKSVTAIYSGTSPYTLMHFGWSKVIGCVVLMVYNECVNYLCLCLTQNLSKYQCFQVLNK